MMKLALRLSFLLVALFITVQEQALALQDSPLIPTAGRWKITFPGAYNCTIINEFVSNDFMTISQERSNTSIADIEYSQTGDLNTGYLNLRQYEDYATSNAILTGRNSWTFVSPGRYSSFDTDEYRSEAGNSSYNYSDLRVITPERMEATMTMLNPGNICRLTARLELLEAVAEWSTTFIGVSPRPLMATAGIPLMGMGANTYAILPVLSPDLSLHLEGDLEGLTGQLKDAAGSPVEPIATADEENSRVEVYNLQRTAIYTYEVTAPANYTLTMLNSDVLSENAGVLAIGDSVSGSVGTGEKTVYNIAGNPGDRITIYADTRNNAAAYLLDGAGFPVTALYYGSVDGKATIGYLLTGSAPYHFLVQGYANTSYSVSIAPSEESVEDRGHIQSGQTVTIAPAKSGYVSYRLDESNGSLIAIMNGFFDAIVNVLDEQGSPMNNYAIFSDAQSSRAGGLFVLPSSGPHTITLYAPEGSSHTLSILSGKRVVSTTTTEPRVAPSASAPLVQRVNDEKKVFTLEVVENQPMILLGQDETGEWALAVTLDVPKPALLWGGPVSYWIEKAVLTNEDGSPLGDLAVIPNSTPPETATTQTTETACVVSAASTVNLRSGPGTNFDIAGKLPAGQEEQPTGRTEIVNNTVWWQLADGNWVRSDVVNETGACEAVPVVAS